jgi:hypothetical protein
MRAVKGQPGFSGTDIDVQVFTAGYLSELRLLDRMGEHRKALELVEPILAGMEELGAGLHKEHELEFWFILCCVHIGAGEVNKALFWINKVLNDTEPTPASGHLHARAAGQPGGAL